MAVESGSDRRSRVILASALAAGFVALCGLPYLRWSAHPSLFDDDFLRVGSLRRATLGEALFRPFNEHMAPLFEVVSWVAWRAAGRSVLAVPRAFQLASFAAFGTSVGLLWALIRLELRSNSTALAAVAAFCLSAVSAETVLWYSASSFQWAASATIAAWFAAASAAGSPSPRRRWCWLAASAAMATCAPAFSAIGVLAGPLASIRLLAAAGPSALRRAALSVVPWAGTTLYLLIGSRFRYGDVVSASVGRNLDLGAAAWAAARAPSLVLIPGLFGLPDQVERLPGVVAAGLTMAGLVAALAWAIRSRDRPLILGGLAMISGGYLATFATRARPGDLSIFQVQRYHLFPQLGLIWLVAAALAPRWRRLDRRPVMGLAAATGLAAALAVTQYPRMRFVSDWSFRYPEQRQAIEATLRLERTCDRAGITLDQAMRTLEPIRTRWSPRPWPFNPLLHLFAAGPTVARLPDPMVRPTLLASMSPEDREALFGGMEATRYRLPASLRDAPAPAAVARLVSAHRIVAIGEGRYRSEGWPCHLEYRIGPEADGARALRMPGLRATRTLEIWWAGEAGDWSPYRSVRWAPDPAGTIGDGAVALDLLPHWRRRGTRRLRVVLHESGEVSVGAPRFPY